VKTSSEDAEESKPAPDIFEIVLKKLGMEGRDADAEPSRRQVDSQHLVGLRPLA